MVSSVAKRHNLVFYEFIKIDGVVKSKICSLCENFWD